MKNIEIMSNLEKLIKMRDNSSIRFPARVSFAIARNIRVMLPIYEDIYNARMDILKEHGELVGQSDFFSPKEGHEEQIAKELEAINQTECDCSIQKFPFNDIENLELSIDDMDTLYFMVDE